MYGFSKQPELTARCSPWQHKDLHTFFKYAIFYIVKTVTKDMEKKSCHPSPLAFALRILSIAFIFLWFFVCLFCFVSFVHLLLIALKVTELSQGGCSPWPPSLGCSGRYSACLREVQPPESMIQTELVSVKAHFSNSSWTYCMNTYIPIQCYVDFYFSS